MIPPIPRRPPRFPIARCWALVALCFTLITLYAIGELSRSFFLRMASVCAMAPTVLWFFSLLLHREGEWLDHDSKWLDFRRTLREEVNARLIDEARRFRRGEGDDAA